MAKIYINGEFQEEAEAKISVLDHGFLYGDGVFETLRAYPRGIFRIQDHLNRLFRSAERISLPIPWSRGFLAETLKNILLVNRYTEAVLRLSVSRGVGPPGLDPVLCEKPTLVVMARPFTGYPEKTYEHGIPVSIVSTRKIPAAALDPQIKSTNFLNNILARIDSKKSGADEGILLNRNGFLTEGTVSNLFFVKDGTLCTPSLQAGILKGVTRGVILEIAQKLEFPIRKGLFLPEELYQADEAFLTNSSYEAMPICRVDQRTFSIGPVSRRIRQAFRKIVYGNMRNGPEWFDPDSFQTF